MGLDELDRQNRQLNVFESVSRLISARKSLSLFHTEDFYTRLTQIGLFKQSNRVQWFLPDGNAPVNTDWSNHMTRSFTMRLIARNAADLLIIINGDAGDRSFRLPADSSWQTVWSSAQAEGIEPAPGAKVSVAQHSPDTNWKAMHLAQYALSDMIAHAQNTTHDSTSAMTPQVPSIINQADAFEPLHHADRAIAIAGADEVEATTPTEDAASNPAMQAAQHRTATPPQDTWMVPEYSITLMQQIKPTDQSD